MKFHTKMTAMDLLNFNPPHQLRNPYPDNSDIDQGVRG